MEGSVARLRSDLCLGSLGEQQICHVLNEIYETLQIVENSFQT